MSVTFKFSCYDPDKRWKEIEARLREEFELFISKYVKSNKNVFNDDKEDSDENTSEWIKLRSINSDIDQLEKKIETVKPYGSETRFLVFNQECIKLYTKLDAIGDLSDDVYADIRSKRKESYDRLDSLSDQLTVKAMNNLKKLLESLTYHRNVEMRELIEKIKKFIDGNDKPSIKDIEDYRYQLVEKKNSINKI